MLAPLFYPTEKRFTGTRTQDTFFSEYLPCKLFTWFWGHKHAKFGENRFIPSRAISEHTYILTGNIIMYMCVYIYGNYFTAVAVPPPPVSTLLFYNNLLQRSPSLPLLSLYRLSSPVSAGRARTSSVVPIQYFPRPSRLSILLVCPNHTDCRFCSSSVIPSSTSIISHIVSFRILSNLPFLEPLSR
jgi:hypothetical protein